MMHIPLVQVEDRQELYRLIEKRPFALSVSAHTHFQEHVFIDSKDGWMGKEPHHHVINVTVCGSWWSGANDERGIPHATMSDGGPNGYSIFTFDGANYAIEFRAAGKPSHRQMQIDAPEYIAAADAPKTEVVVNVFGGSDRSKVQMRVGEKGEWKELKQVRGEDPFFKRLKELEASPAPPPGRQLPAPHASAHIWRGFLPEGLTVGTHAIEVQTTDMFGKVHLDRRTIRIDEPKEPAKP